MKHCLVVDDSRVIRKVASSIVAGFAFETQEAEDAAGALEACRVNMPELVLLDANMANSNAFEFLRNLRREPQGDKPVVLLCVTENDVIRINEALLAGANDYVLKPYDRAAIEERLASTGLI